MSARMAIVRVFTGPPDELTTVPVILSLSGLCGKPARTTGAAPGSCLCRRARGADTS
jgi:hypothetical protein